MSGLAIAVIGMVVLATVGFLKYLSGEGKAVRYAQRVNGNLHRMRLSRTVNDGFYHHENEDGSMAWRRVPAE